MSEDTEKTEGLVEIYGRIIKELEMRLTERDFQVEELKKEIAELRARIYV